MKRIKPKITIPKTRDEAEAILGRIAELKAFESKTKAIMDQRLIEVREEYERQLVETAEELQPLCMQMQAWGESNPGTFGKSKSVEMIHGIIGWRIGMPCLKLLSGWTWAMVLDALRNLGHQAFIRTKEDVDKEAILARRADLLDGDLRQFGTKIVQAESFFIEPKLTE
jgi:phage host-nuclease inhibitor protein Gam